MKVLLENVNNDNRQLLQQLAKALGLKFKIVDEAFSDETEYLKSSPSMKQHLDNSIEEEKQGKAVKVSLDEIWK